MQVLKNNGYKFIEFIETREEDITLYQPLRGSFAVLKSSGKYLMCYNTWREQWEVPAGHREVNETPKECAIRELYEETGQIVKDLDFKGLVKTQNISTGKVKYNPIYFAYINALQPFLRNTETSKICLWDLKEKIECVDEVDFAILNTLSIQYTNNVPK
ncbi:NUDIX hydrolase [Solibacillus sp. FSL W7-1436]|uniref:NUDIX hydrolase n=1 Tax=Solibacillus sp. FSL W7-1436 TaxID=2921705 RepID=UPI0030FD05C3